MPATYAGFVDAGYLRAEGAKAIGKRAREIRLDARGVVEWLRGMDRRRDIVVGEFLRAYWYDGAFHPSHKEYDGQRRYFDAIGHTPGVQLRLGHIAERPSRIERPIRRELRRTAEGFGIDPDDFLSEFDRRWTFYPDRQQKGVDTLIALDMVRLAGRSAFSAAVLIAGDRDLAEVVRTVQDFGIRAIIATPNRQSVAAELAQLADGVIEIQEDDCRKMLTDRASTSR